MTCIRTVKRKKKKGKNLLISEYVHSVEKKKREINSKAEFLRGE